MNASLRLFHSQHKQPENCIILAGPPNAGKTSLFNHLTGLNAHTSNFPGTTVEVREGEILIDKQPVRVLDLPGTYGLSGNTLDQKAAQEVIAGNSPSFSKPDLLVVVIDATRISHHLALVAELLEQDLPTIVVLNMMDEAERKNLTIDIECLQQELNTLVISVSTRTKKGLPELKALISSQLEEIQENCTPSRCSLCTGCSTIERCTWADHVSSRALHGNEQIGSPRSDYLDSFLTSPLYGLPFFLLVMFGLFGGVFTLASYPMDWIDGFFGFLSNAASRHIPNELLSSLIADGIIGGIGGVLVFLPQICILFFGISLLQDSGYLSRAVVAVDRIMRKFGLPGQAFVPLLSAHACAIPAIMSTRVIENPKDRLRAILVIPLLTCSARLPVYLMIAVLLFGNNPLWGSLLFVSGYFLGGIAAVTVSFLLQRTIVRSSPEHLAIELPPYRLPSFRVAFAIAYDRAKVFLKQAGTFILLFSLVLWAAATFPRLPEDQLAQYARPDDATRLAHLSETLATSPSVELEEEYNHLADRYALEYSAAGRVGKFVEPLFAPLGFDWRLSIGILSSFAAREVIVSVLSVISGVEETSEGDNSGLIASLREMKRSNGSLLFDIPTALSLFVFFVLAMQCLPTQAVTFRETRSWKWPLFQLGYMTLLAYGAAFMTYRLVTFLSY
ncbi:MAG: ferrous iron transporter B [Bdellovibrionales bacterium]|nr:ferrous iron transporter B [Bdellovibrionales bacterium]